MNILPDRFNSFAATLPKPIVEPEIPDTVEICQMGLNEAPVLPSPKALAAASDALTKINRYPDHSAPALVGQIANLSGIPADHISVGNGSGEILFALAQIAIRPADTAVIPSPTFAMCGKGVQMAGGKPINVPLREDGTNNISAMLAAVTDTTRLFYICTPNNPTGGVCAAQDLARTAQELPDDCLMVVDEAYFEFARAMGGPDVLSILQYRTRPWVVTRSFSKAYCLAGLRIGYALCSSRELRDALWSLRPSFNVSRPALAAACAALADTEYLARVLERNFSERTRMVQALAAMGCSSLAGATNFLAVRPAGVAVPLVAELRMQGVLVRAIPWPDAGGLIRVSVGTRGENDRFLKVLASLLDK